MGTHTAVTDVNLITQSAPPRASSSGATTPSASVQQATQRSGGTAASAAAAVAAYAASLPGRGTSASAVPAAAAVSNVSTSGRPLAGPGVAGVGPVPVPDLAKGIGQRPSSTAVGAGTAGASARGAGPPTGSLPLRQSLDIPALAGIKMPSGPAPAGATTAAAGVNPAAGISGRPPTAGVQSNGSSVHSSQPPSSYQQQGSMQVPSHNASAAQPPLKEATNYSHSNRSGGTGSASSSGTTDADKGKTGSPAEVASAGRVSSTTVALAHGLSAGSRAPPPGAGAGAAVGAGESRRPAAVAVPGSEQQQAGAGAGPGSAEPSLISPGSLASPSPRYV